MLFDLIRGGSRNPLPRWSTDKDVTMRQPSTDMSVDEAPPGAKRDFGSIDDDLFKSALMFAEKLTEESDGEGSDWELQDLLEEEQADAQKMLTSLPSHLSDYNMTATDGNAAEKSGEHMKSLMNAFRKVPVDISDEGWAGFSRACEMSPTIATSEMKRNSGQRRPLCGEELTRDAMEKLILKDLPRMSRSPSKIAPTRAPPSSPRRHPKASQKKKNPPSPVHLLHSPVHYLVHTTSAYPLQPTFTSHGAASFYVKSTPSYPSTRVHVLNNAPAYPAPPPMFASPPPQPVAFASPSPLAHHMTRNVVSYVRPTYAESCLQMTHVSSPCSGSTWLARNKKKSAVPVEIYSRPLEPGSFSPVPESISVPIGISVGSRIYGLHC